MQDIDLNTISIDPLHLPVCSAKKIEISVLRLDKIHPVISGNKWFKLRYYLEEAKSLHKNKIATFGGAWSNHIVATAAACQLYGMGSTGIIRGEEAAELSPTLTMAKRTGMQLFFISREQYSRKKIPDTLHVDDTYFISEGGYGLPGALGAATMLDHVIKENYTHICCAAGTGTMAAGLSLASVKQNIIVAVSVLKNNPELEKQVLSLLPPGITNTVFVHDYHFGGYAKHQPDLIRFMNEFFRLTSIPSDFVYTGKLFYGILDLAGKGYFPPGSRLLLVHSGGLQGNESLRKGTLIFQNF